MFQTTNQSTILDLFYPQRICRLAAQLRHSGLPWTAGAQAAGGLLETQLRPCEIGGAETGGKSVDHLGVYQGIVRRLDSEW